MLRLDILLKELDKKLLFMISLTEEIMRNSMSYYFEHQESVFTSVNSLEDTINEYENAVDEQAIRIFALEHPVAFDLRKVFMSIKMNTDLERIGDIAYNIAHRAHGTIQNAFYGVQPATTQNPLLIENYQIFQEMLGLIKNALTQENIELCKKVVLLDKKIDENNSNLFRDVLGKCITEPSHINFYINEITISKNLERAGDHCTNLAQEIIYVFSGVNVKHQEFKV